MILALLLLQAAATSASAAPPERFSILVKPCGRASGETVGNDVVVCGDRANAQRLPLPDERVPTGPVASNPYLRPDVALAARHALRRLSTRLPGRHRRTGDGRRGAGNRDRHLGRHRRREGPKGAGAGRRQARTDPAGLGSISIASGHPHPSAAAPLPLSHREREKTPKAAKGEGDQC